MMLIDSVSINPKLSHSERPLLSMKKTAILIYSLILPLLIFAATHSEDYLVVDNKGHFIRANPLNRYLSLFCKEELLDDYVNNFCVSNWPNYTRHWEIKDDRLYLVKIESNKQEQYPLDLLFPLYDGSPIDAKWFTGIMSYRWENSPIIQLNREYYEEEAVISVVKGGVDDRFKIDHRERWISYSRRLMEKYRPLAYDIPNFPSDSPGSAGRMAEFLEDAFSVVTHPAEKPSVYYPIIRIEFNADLDALQLKEAHRELSSYELLETVAEETHTTMDITISNRVVIYEIKETESVQ